MNGCTSELLWWLSEQDNAILLFLIGPTDKLLKLALSSGTCDLHGYNRARFSLFGGVLLDQGLLKGTRGWFCVLFIVLRCQPAGHFVPPQLRTSAAHR